MCCMKQDEIKYRDELVRFSVKHLKMTLPQILECSKTWERPFYDEQGVWRRLEAMKLQKKVRFVAEQSLHDLWVIRVCLKIWRDAHRNGIVISGIEKEYRVEDSGIRCDMKFFLNDRLYLLETQATALTFRGWKAKLGKYVRYRKRKGVRPFRVLIVMENKSNLNTVFRYARELTAGHPNLELFLLGWMPDVLSQYDTTGEDIWVPNRLVDRKIETVSLV